MTIANGGENKEDQLTSHSANNFDFLRFFFASVVIFSHSFDLSFGGTREPLKWATHGQEDLGRIAVDGFFAISGFLITVSWLRSKSFIDYALKRVLRIYPAFIVAAIFCAFVAGPYGADSSTHYFQHFHIKSFVVQTVLLGSFKHPPVFLHNPFKGEINGSIWTIRKEFECYLAVAVLGSLGLLRLRWPSAALLVVCSAALFLLIWNPMHVKHLSDNAIEHLRFVTDFLTGMTFVLYRKSIPFKPIWLAVAAAVLIAADLAHVLTAVLPIPAAYFLFYFSFLPTARLHRFGRYCDLSYGIYLFAFPIQQMLVARFGAGLNAYTLFLESFAVTLCFAAVSWFLIEKPSLALKPKPSAMQSALEDRQTEPAAAK